jgi:hypothetical protein
MNELDTEREKANEVEVAVEVELRNRRALFRMGAGVAAGRRARSSKNREEAWREAKQNMILKEHSPA